MDIKEKIAQANEKTVHMLMDSDPVWVDMKPAIECVDGLEDHMILHSGPPIAYEDMTMLHKRGMVSAMLFEGWAKDEEEAVKRLKAGEIKISRLSRKLPSPSTAPTTAPKWFRASTS